MTSARAADVGIEIADLLARPRPHGAPRVYGKLDAQCRRIFALDRHGRPAGRIVWRDAVAAWRREYDRPRDGPPSARDRLGAARMLAHGLARGVLEEAPGPRGGRGWRVRDPRQTGRAD